MSSKKAPSKSTDDASNEHQTHHTYTEKKKTLKRFAIPVMLFIIIYLFLPASLVIALFTYPGFRSNSKPLEQKPVPSNTYKSDGKKTNTTPDPTQTAPTTSNQNAQNSNNNFVPGVCKRTTIPHQTVYENTETLYVGQTQVAYSGTDGWRQTCTANSNGYKPDDVVFDGMPTKILVGTKPIPPPQPPAPSYSYDYAMNVARNRCSPIAQGSGTGSSAYQVCISTVLKDYGY